MVPRQTASSSQALEEDDGVVLAMVTDSDAKCFLLVSNFHGRRRRCQFRRAQSHLSVYSQIVCLRVFKAHRQK